MPDVTAERAGYVAALPTFAQSAAMIGIHPSGIGRAVKRLGIEPVRWGNRDKHLSVADLMRLADDAHRESLQTVAGRLLEQVTREHPDQIGAIQADIDAFSSEVAPPRSKTVLRSPLEPDTARRLVALYTLPSAPEEP
jgi:hypothetical protein